MNIKSIAVLALAALAAVVSPVVNASDSCTRIVTVDYCARYVCTKEICRRTECRWSYDRCGRRYSYEVTVITFADYYSDGSRRSYTRTYRA